MKVSNEWLARVSQTGRNRERLAAALAPRIACPAAKVEPRAGHEPVAEEAAARPHRPLGGPVCIRYQVGVARLGDADGLCSKYATDALVSAGILADDTTAFIPESPTTRQVQHEVEDCVIEIWEV